MTFSYSKEASDWSISVGNCLTGEYIRVCWTKRSKFLAGRTFLLDDDIKAAVDAYFGELGRSEFCRGRETLGHLNVSRWQEIMLKNEGNFTPYKDALTFSGTG